MENHEDGEHDEGTEINQQVFAPVCSNDQIVLNRMGSTFHKRVFRVLRPLIRFII